MKKSLKGIILGIGITLAISCIIFSAHLEPAFAEERTENEQKLKYFLGEYNGNLAIFNTEESLPTEILDIRLDSLPERDIKRIKNGIASNDLNEIIKVIEDYE